MIIRIYGFCHRGTFADEGILSFGGGIFDKSHHIHVSKCTIRIVVCLFIRMIPYFPGIIVLIHNNIQFKISALLEQKLYNL